jgi:hypothetical protein
MRQSLDNMYQFYHYSFPYQLGYVETESANECVEWSIGPLVSSVFVETWLRDELVGGTRWIWMTGFSYYRGATHKLIVLVLEG